MTHIFNLTKKLQQCNEYIGQLEHENQLLSDNLQKTVAAQKADELSRYRQRKQAMLRPIHEMAAFVDSEFEFRHNVVRDSYEYRRRRPAMTAGQCGEEAAGRPADNGWLPVDERQMNTIMNRVQDDGQVFCLKSLVQQRIRSEMAVDYHPVVQWLSQLRGTWDGIDRVAPLAARINGSDYCRRMMAVWLRAVVAQWLGVDDNHANAVMLLLVSPRQGLHKSSFLHALLPDELESYYTDDFTLASRSQSERKLVEFALLNIDEFDKLPAKKMPDLKTLMQTLRPSFVKAYKTNFNQLPRIASFVGTSNSRQLLTDRSGSRRFLILEPDGMIDIDAIDHRQLYAQLLHEVETGQRYYFTKDEEQEMQRRNERYYKPDAVELLFTEFFRAATDADSPDSVLLRSAGQLMDSLSHRRPSLLRPVSETSFGTMLRRLSIPREHHHSGNVYRVVAL
jgi:hypothetical protein